jgi:hypothetical protein
MYHIYLILMYINIVLDLASYSFSFITCIFKDSLQFKAPVNQTIIQITLISPLIMCLFLGPRNTISKLIDFNSSKYLNAFRSEHLLEHYVYKLNKSFSSALVQRALRNQSNQQSYLVPITNIFSRIYEN